MLKTRVGLEQGVIIRREGPLLMKTRCGLGLQGLFKRGGKRVLLLLQTEGGVEQSGFTRGGPLLMKTG